MLVQLLDAEAQPHWVTWQGQDQINDFSSTLGAGAVGVGSVPQQIAPANTGRAGFLFQNTSANAMLIFEIGIVAAAFLIPSGGFFPPCGYPIPTSAISVQGSAASALADTFTYREWQNAVGE